MLLFDGTDDQYDDRDFVPVEVKAGKNEKENIRIESNCYRVLENVKDYREQIGTCLKTFITLKSSKKQRCRVAGIDEFQ